MQLQALPAFSDNYIWALSARDGRALIVDPGEAAPVFTAADKGLVPGAILLTHHHQDHVGGTEGLLGRWPDLPVVAPHDERITTATQRVGDGDRLQLEGWQLEIIGLPGHTLTHIAFHLSAGDQAGVLFCGDTLFSLGCGRLFEGSPAQMLASLERLASLRGDTRVCCGHEYTLANAAFAGVVDPENPALRRRTEEAQAMRDAAQPSLPSTIASELACNPFLRCNQPEIQSAVARHQGHLPLDPLETFTALRRWKDGFRA